MKYILLFFVFLTTSFDIQSAVEVYSVSEYTSTRNFPVIMKNERIDKDRCRLHLDNDQQLEVACQQEPYNS